MGKAVMKLRDELIVNSRPHTGGGVPVPLLIANLGSDASQKFTAYFRERIRDRELYPPYVASVARFCAWVEEHDFDLWTFTPYLVSAYLEECRLLGSTLEAVRQEWRAVRMTFDWLYSVRLVRINAAAGVADPIHGFMAENEADLGRPSAIEISASAVTHG